MTNAPTCSEWHREITAQRAAGIVTALGLLLLTAWMLATFLPALAWAVVLAVAMWPVFVVARFRVGRAWGAIAVTALIVVVVLTPLVAAAVEAAREFHGIAQWVIELRRTGIETPAWIADLPLIGSALADWINSRLHGDQGIFAGADARSLTEWGRVVGGQVARRVTTLLFAVLIMFFIFLESDGLLRQVEAVGDRLLGPPAQRFGRVAAAAVRGTVDGLLLVGLAEAILLGVAYAVCGLPHPSLLGVLTGLLSAVPFASPVVFIAAALWLLSQSAVPTAIGLLAFGGLVVFVADHFVRPALIGGSTRLPFIWVLLGILGGVESFGLLGLFLGPTLLAVLITLWRELAAD